MVQRGTATPRNDTSTEDILPLENINSSKSIQTQLRCFFFLKKISRCSCLINGTLRGQGSPQQGGTAIAGCCAGSWLLPDTCPRSVPGASQLVLLQHFPC